MPQCRSCNVTLMAQHAVTIGSYTYCEDCATDDFCNCGCCGHYTLRDRAILVSDILYCPGCYASLIRCDHCGRRTLPSQIQDLCGASYCSRCYERMTVTCENCSEVTNRHHARSTPNDEIWCPSCYDEACVTCDNCERAIWSDDAQETNGRVYCSRCYRDRCREWESKPFVCASPTYELIGSTRKFGVELETCECPRHIDVRDNTIWECKPDCSIEGLEFVSPVLFGDAGLADIEHLCDMAMARSWRTNRYCGYHAHFDVTNESWEALRNIAYAYRKTYELWCCLVSDARSSNPMCGAPDYSCDDIKHISSDEDWEYFVGARDRFEWVNWRAYLAHGTMEVRSHDASLNKHEICNWVKVHARFMDFAKAWSPADLDTLLAGNIYQQFEALTEIIGNDLATFYANRANAHGKSVVAPTRQPATRRRRVSTGADF